MARTFLVRRGVLFPFLALVALWSSPAHAQAKRQFDVAPGTLSSAIVELGQQARVPIGMIGNVDAAVRTPALRGRMSVEQALHRLLAGTGLTFRKTASGDYVIVRAPPFRSASTDRPRLPPSARDDANDRIIGDAPIVVTASKNQTALSGYPGSVAILELDGDQVAARPEGGTAVLIDNLPVLAATNLGPGRNKLFARGIADSSFNGQSQSNLSVYLGDLRLSYAGPDPDLNLFDIRRVEVLTGPYGTLYGTGALGGVIRLEPNAPDPGRASGRLTGHLSSVRHGGTGHGAAAMLNLPLASDRLALRLVGYRTIDAGYIDDTFRDLSDINRVVTTGGRSALRATDGQGLDVELGFVFQRISARDSQYSNDASMPLTTRSEQAQPYSSEYLMPSLTLRKSWDNLDLVSATGWSRQVGKGLSSSLGIFAYPETRRNAFLSHETRLSGGSDALRFLAGISFARNLGREEREEHFLGLAGQNFELRGRTHDLALFGEMRLALSERLATTVGGRLNHVSETRRTIFTDAKLEASAQATRLNFLPSLSLAWTPTDGLLLFLAYRSGSRSGNLLPVPDFTAPRVVTSAPDRLSSIEAGWRYTPLSTLSFATTFSYTHWNDAQADLATAAGNFRTVNLGDAHIWGMESSATWTPLPRVALSSALFLNNSPAFRLSSEADQIVPDSFLAAGDRIPNIASVGARATLAYEAPLFGDVRFRLAAAMRYYGNSVAEFDSLQPEYLEVGTEARLTWKCWAMTLGLTNVTDVRGNRFAIGNRFSRGTFNEPQSTPLQPRTIRLGLEAGF